MSTPVIRFYTKISKTLHRMCKQTRPKAKNRAKRRSQRRFFRQCYCEGATSVSRKYRCTDGSPLSSGWNAVTSILPCCAATIRLSTNASACDWPNTRFPQQLALHGAFPAGEDQPVKRTVQVLFLPELENVRPKGCKHPLVFDEGPLQGQYGNAHRSFASFRHQQLDFLLIDADHSLP